MAGYATVILSGRRVKGKRVRIPHDLVTVIVEREAFREGKLKRSH